MQVLLGSVRWGQRGGNVVVVGCRRADNTGRNRVTLLLPLLPPESSNASTPTTPAHPEETESSCYSSQPEETDSSCYSSQPEERDSYHPEVPAKARCGMFSVPDSSTSIVPSPGDAKRTATCLGGHLRVVWKIRLSSIADRRLSIRSAKSC